MEFKIWLEAFGDPNVTLQKLEQKAYNAIIALMRDVDANKNNPSYNRFFEKENKVIYFKRLEKMLRALTSQQAESMAGVVGGLAGAGLGGMAAGVPGAVVGGALGYLGGKMLQGTGHYRLERTALGALADLIDFIQKNYANLNESSKYRVWHYWKLLHSTANVLDASQAQTYDQMQKVNHQIPYYWGRHRMGWGGHRRWH